jgi:predicted metal-dependent peptidase
MSEKKAKEISAEVYRAAEQRMGNSKARLLLQQPFYGVLLSMMDFVPEAALPTMATDGSKTYYNPEFVMRLAEDEVFGVLLHEISHCIYLHCTTKRRMNRESHRWNIACDFAINLEIKNMGYKFPQSWKDDNGQECKPCLDEKYRDMNAEQIFDKMTSKEAEKQSTFDVHIEDSDSGNWDDMEDKIISAYEMSKNTKGKGDLPAGIKRWIDKMRKSRVQWQRIFWKYVGSALAKDDYSYVRVNKRFLGQDIYLPDLRSNIIGDVVVAVDTSGSIGKECLTQFAAEIAKIGHLVNEITVMTADAAVQEVIKVHRFQNFLDKLHFKGGGGTSFKVCFDKVKELNLKPDIFIYLTDMYGDQDQCKPPPYPVLWVSTSEINKAPFGIVVQMPNENGKDW